MIEYRDDGRTDVTIPEGVTSIGGFAFYNCSSLTCVVIPDSVKHIEWIPFSNCRNLTIHASSKSFAKQYALEHNISFVEE